ncbi:hypothetical protein BJP40_05765 [Streptomyces sp. CC53]|nr:hypothetical protein BJP40_05765 [Streptomyces sp. CC53]
MRCRGRQGEGEGRLPPPLRRPAAPPGEACRCGRRGETGTDLPADLVLDTLAGAVFFHLGIIGERPAADLAPRIARMVGKGVGVR